MPTDKENEEILSELTGGSEINVMMGPDGKPVKATPFGSILPPVATQRPKSLLESLSPDLPPEYRITKIEQLVTTLANTAGAAESLPPMIIASLFPDKFPKTMKRMEDLMAKGASQAMMPSMSDILQDFGAPTVPAMIGGMALDIAMNPLNTVKFAKLSNLGTAFENLKTAPKLMFAGATDINSVIANAKKLDIPADAQRRIVNSLNTIKNSPEAKEFLISAEPKEIKKYLLGRFEELDPKIVESTLKSYEDILQIKLPFLKPFAPLKGLQRKIIQLPSKEINREIIQKSPIHQLFSASTGNQQTDNFLMNIKNRGDYITRKEYETLNEYKKEMISTVNDYLKASGKKPISGIFDPKSIEETENNLYKITTAMRENAELRPEQAKKLESMLASVSDESTKSKIKTGLLKNAKQIGDYFDAKLKNLKLHAVPIEALEDEIRYVPHAITTEGRKFIGRYGNIIAGENIPEEILSSGDTEAIYKWINANVKPITMKPENIAPAFKGKIKPQISRIAPFYGMDIDAVNQFMKNHGFGYEGELDKIRKINPNITTFELEQYFKNKPVAKEFFSSNPMDYMTKYANWYANKINLSETIMDAATKFGRRADESLPSDFIRTERGTELAALKKNWSGLMNPGFKRATRETLNDPSIQKYRKIKQDGKLIHVPLNPDELNEFSKKGNVFTKNVPANMAGVDDYEQLLVKYKFPKDVAEDLGKYLKSMSTPTQVNSAFNTIFDVTNFWKKLITLKPKYWTANFISNLVNNAFEGLTNPLRYSQAHQIQVLDAMVKNGVWDANTVKPMILKTVTGREIDAYKLYKMYAEKYLMNSGFFLRDLERANRPMSRNALEALSRGRLFESSGILNNWMENNTKLAMFFDRIIKGDTIEKAMQTTQKVTFNYGDVTQFEKTLRKSVIPFYTWKKKNLMYHLQKFISDPGIYSTLNVASRDTEKILNELLSENPDARQNLNTSMENIMPGWMRRMPGFVLANEKGEISKIPIDRFFPPADVLALMTMPEQLYSLITPFLMKPIQYGRDINFFVNKRYSEDVYQPKYGKQLYHNFLGFKITSPILYDILSNIPGLSDLNKLNPGNIFATRTEESKIKEPAKHIPFIGNSIWAKMADKRPEEIRNKQENLFNYLIGRVYKIDPVYNEYRIGSSMAKIPQDRVKELKRGAYSQILGVMRMAEEGEISNFDAEKFKREYMQNMKKEDIPELKRQMNEFKENLKRLKHGTSGH